MPAAMFMTRGIAVTDEPKHATPTTREEAPLGGTAYDSSANDESAREDGPHEAGSAGPTPDENAQRVPAPSGDAEDAGPSTDASDSGDQRSGDDHQIDRRAAAARREEAEVAQWADDDDLADLGDDDSEEAGYEEEGGDVKPLEESETSPVETQIEERPLDWYILKVQSNREESIAEALRRRVKVAGQEEYFHEIIVPTEMVTEFKGGKKKIVKRKLYPGYIVVHMIINDETWFLVRETPGIGDFTGSAGRPTPMLANEVARIIPKEEDTESEEPKLQIPVDIGDRVKINEGTFENFEGEVDSIDTTNGRVTVMINIFGRSTPVELEYWQIETL